MFANQYLTCADDSDISSLMCVQAAQILVRSESEGPWLKEILEEVHKGADRLFKMIGEAYSVLSDPTKVCFLSTTILPMDTCYV